MAVLRKNIDIYTTKYDNLLFFNDFNARLEDVPIKIFCLAYTLTNKINKPTCYKNHEKPSCVELILTNCPRSFQNSCALEIGLSDFHKMVTTVMITTFRKMEPKIIKYRDYNFFFNNTFRESLRNIFLQNLRSNCDDHYNKFVISWKTFLIKLLHGKRSM